MSFVSLRFLLFAVILFVVYYAVPKRFQWMILLLASMVFYTVAGVAGLVFLLATSVTIHCGALGLQTMTKRQSAYLKEHKGEMTKEERRLWYDFLKQLPSGRSASCWQRC